MYPDPRARCKAVIVPVTWSLLCGVGSSPPSAGLEVTHGDVAVNDRDGAGRRGEGFRAHDCEGMVEGHHVAAPYAPGGMHAIVTVRTPTDDEAIFPQLKEGHVHLITINSSPGGP